MWQFCRMLVFSPKNCSILIAERCLWTGMRSTQSCLLQGPRSHYLFIMSVGCSSLQTWCLKWGAATTGPKDEAPGGSGVDQRGWKRVLVGQNVYGKGIMQKKWIKLLISGRNGGSNFLHPPIGGRHRLLYFRTNIKATNMKEIQQGNLLAHTTPVNRENMLWWNILK